MKFIFVCVTVCAIALNSSFDFANAFKRPHGPDVQNTTESGVHRSGPSYTTAYIRHPIVPNGARRGDADASMNLSAFQKELDRRYVELVLRIQAAWDKCNSTYPLPMNDKSEIMVNPPWGDEEKPVSKDIKCHIDCALREMNVITDAGLDMKEYMFQVKQLRFNYTTFNVNIYSDDMKEEIFNVIYNRALNFSNKRCFLSGKYGKFNYHDPEDIEACYNLIRSYAQAALTCNDIKDPRGDSCETSWMIVRCIMMENRTKLFNSAFYPAPFYWDEDYW